MEKTLTLEDCNCAICFKFMVEPVSLDCIHFFCMECVTSLKKKNQKKCPFCRQTTQFNLVINKDTEKKILTLFPVEYKAALIDLQKLRLQQNERKDIKCWVGHQIDLPVEGDDGKKKFSLSLRHFNEKANPICLFKKVTYSLPAPYKVNKASLEFPFIATSNIEGNDVVDCTLDIEFEDWMKAPIQKVVHKLKLDLQNNEVFKTHFIVKVPKINYERFMDFIKDKIDPNYPDLVEEENN